MNWTYYHSSTSSSGPDSEHAIGNASVTASGGNSADAELVAKIKAYQKQQAEEKKKKAEEDEQKKRQQQAELLAREKKAEQERHSPVVVQPKPKPAVGATPLQSATAAASIPTTSARRRSRLHEEKNAIHKMTSGSSSRLVSITRTGNRFPDSKSTH